MRKNPTKHKDKNLIIELDGSQHLDAQEYDQIRDDYLKSLGLIVVRFWNDEVDRDIKMVIEKIKNFCTNNQ